MALYLEFKTRGDKMIIILSGELDHHSAEEVRNRVDDIIVRTGTSKLIMDFKNVNFMDSSGIGMIIGRYKKLSLKKGELYITNAKGSVERVLELSGIFKIIKNYKTIEEAVKHI